MKVTKINTVKIVFFICAFYSYALSQKLIVLNDSISIYQSPDTASKIVETFIITTTIYLDSTKEVNNHKWSYVRTTAFQDPVSKTLIAGWVPGLEYADSTKFIKISKWKYAKDASYCIGDYCPTFKIFKDGKVIRENVPYEIVIGRVKPEEFKGKCYSDNEEWNGQACSSEGHVYKHRNIIWMNIDGWETIDFFVLGPNGKLCSPNCCKFNVNGECVPDY